MEFKIGDKVKYIGSNKRLLGCCGIISRKCRVVSMCCTVVRLPNGSEWHIPIKYLKLNQKNQQLLFSFMD